MNSISIGLITLACIAAGLFLGMLLRTRLPDHHLKDDSKDIVKTATALIATLVALVLGLLVGSAKNSLDSTNEGLTQAGAKVIALDRVLARYGADARSARDLLRTNIRGAVDRIWPSDRANATDMAAVERSTAAEDLDDKIRDLAPKTEAQKQLQAQALEISRDIQQWRWLLIEKTQAALPPVFLVVLIFWLTILFASFGLLSPRNPTTITTLMVAAASISCAVFLILEMNRPFGGMIQASSSPLTKALAIIGK